MILVDTSIWIDHLHASDDQLAAMLVDGDVGCHPAIIEEIALGSIAGRGQVLDLLGNLVSFPVLTHEELLHLVDTRRLWGRGLSAVDAGLLGSVMVSPGARLWTRDKRLKSAAIEVGVVVVAD